MTPTRFIIQLRTSTCWVESGSFWEHGFCSTEISSLGSRKYWACRKTLNVSFQGSRTFGQIREIIFPLMFFSVYQQLTTTSIKSIQKQNFNKDRSFRWSLDRSFHNSSDRRAKNRTFCAFRRTSRNSFVDGENEMKNWTTCSRRSQISTKKKLGPCEKAETLGKTT